ncbi:DUF4362 domain-containing protein [Bacillus sp. FJAT-42376]|uniref:DUF4362 domain-containing protein n=1 Tax=Bacillus sp. FJAT-42376 TaxID=2014076 RepID=UPI0013DD8F32|nr:DUF4362 domain-containing protein [Bacillus sp. FJAT-42376]
MKKRMVCFMVGIGMTMSGCSGINPFNGYTPSSEDIINTHGEIKNFERFAEFTEHAEKGIKDQIRIVSYTTEGDPILQDLEFDGKLIKLRHDSSRDQYGSEEVTYASCKAIEKKKG